MNLQESIRRIIREESLIPLAIRRRASFEDIEEAFDTSLEQNAASMYNPNSIIFKEKEGTTLWIFAKFVIDDMVTFLEQDYFNDEDRIYFSDTEEDDKTYHEKIRQPLLKHYGKRIKEKFDEVRSDGLNETFLKEETIKKFDKTAAKRGKFSDILEKLVIDYIGEENICDVIAAYVGGTYVIMVLYNGLSMWNLDSKIDKHLKSFIPLKFFTMITDTKCNEN